MAVTIQDIISNINLISAALDENVFIKKARETFKENIQEYEVADDEKAKMIATYEAQVSVGVINEIMQMAKEIPEIIAREANIVKETELKGKQTDLVTQQECVEKGKTMLIAEQVVSEKYRHRDLRSSTAVKMASLEVTQQQAKFEEARRYIAIEANYQNAFMKKADFKVQQLQAIATDDDITISAEQMADSKSTIDGIPTDKINYQSEVSLNKPAIESDVIPSITITCNNQG
jgi:hypothetical protein